MGLELKGKKGREVYSKQRLCHLLRGVMGEGRVAFSAHNAYCHSHREEMGLELGKRAPQTSIAKRRNHTGSYANGPAGFPTDVKPDPTAFNKRDKC